MSDNNAQKKKGDLKQSKKKSPRSKTQKTKKNAQSIGAKLQYSINMLMGISIAVLVITAIVLNVVSTLRTLRSDMGVMAGVTADRVSQELQVAKAIVSEIGTIKELSSPSYTEEKKQEMINERVVNYGMVRGKLISSKGICEYDGTDYSDRDYFQKSMQGEVVVSDPMIAKTDGKLSIIISAPTWAAGKVGGAVSGVVFLVPQYEFLNDIMKDIEISKNASCYALNSTGITIAHSEDGIAELQQNTIELAKTDSSLRARAKLEEKMIAGESGYSLYMEGLSVKILAYAPIPETNGWSVAIDAPLTDFLGPTYVCSVVAVVIAALALIMGTRTAKLIGKSIGDPIKLCAERLTLLAEGDLHSPMPVINSEDETRILANATESLASGLKLVIEDADYLLGEMSEGNFAVSVEKEDYYVGDFHGLVESITKLNKRLSDTLKDIQEAVEQVTMGAGQMADTAQALAEGATDQAGAVQELQATITNVTSMVADSAEALGGSYQLAKEYQQQAVTSGEEMQNLTKAMISITETSRQINNIIEEIEDIASQTNLLSLNAAIEAARAGEAGRGFAVVADQIRKLADDSAQSAVHTRELIETSLQEIERGNQIAESILL